MFSGLGHDPADIDRIIAERKERKVQAARENPIGGHGGKRDSQVDNINLKTTGGTSRDYTLRRLARDNPALLKKCEDGELSAIATLPFVESVVALV